jgi:RNA polymerase-interacting CarD/CdnL/TRCF family regulator
MKRKRKFKVGDKIVELGQVFAIFKIKKIRNGNGELERVIFFKPYFKTKIATNLTCSIPENSIKETGIRRPISPKELGRLIKKLGKKGDIEKAIVINEAKNLLKLNQPSETVELLRMLWLEKNQKPESFSKSKKDIFNLALTRLIEEFALVGRTSLEKAKKEINLALQKGK